MSTSHWIIALHTGLLTGLLAVLLTFTLAAKVYGHRYDDAIAIGCLIVIDDVYSHASRHRIPYVEHIETGIVSGLLALATSYLLKTQGRHLSQ
jgi:hypothetical protein